MSHHPGSGITPVGPGRAFTVHGCPPRWEGCGWLVNSRHDDTEESTTHSRLSTPFLFFSFHIFIPMSICSLFPRFLFLCFAFCCISISTYCQYQCPHLNLLSISFRAGTRQYTRWSALEKTESKQEQPQEQGDVGPRQRQRVALISRVHPHHLLQLLISWLARKVCSFYVGF